MSINPISFSNNSTSFSKFTQLRDTPNSFLGQALKRIRINSIENAIEFYADSQVHLDDYAVVPDGLTVPNGTMTLGSAVLNCSGALFVSSDVGKIISVRSALSKPWAPNAAFTTADFVIPSTPNGKYYQCTTAGTSGGGEPAWPTTDSSTVANGSIVWTCRLYGKTLTGTILSRQSSTQITLDVSAIISVPVAGAVADSNLVTYGTDNYAVVQGVLSANTGNIILPMGTMLINGNLSPQSLTKLIGYGRGISNLLAFNLLTNNTIDIAGRSQVSASDFSILNSSNAMLIRSSTDIDVKNLSISGTYNAGINCQVQNLSVPVASQRLNLCDNYLSNIGLGHLDGGGHAISFTANNTVAYPQDITVNRNIITEVYSSGINVSETYFATVSNNSVHDSGTPNSSGFGGIRIDNGAKFVNAMGNTITGKTRGIFVLTGAHDVNLIGNNIINSGYQGIFINADATQPNWNPYHVNVLGNVITDPWVLTDATPASRVGLYILGAKDCTAIGNTISCSTGNMYYGIAVRNRAGTYADTCRSDNAIVSNNYCEGATGNNYFLYTDSDSGAYNNKVPVGCIFDGNRTNSVTIPVIASASAITLLTNDTVLTISGTTNINNIYGGFFNRKVTLYFSGILTVKNGTGNLILNGDYTTAANNTLSMIYNETTAKWYEISRSNASGASGVPISWGGSTATVTISATGVLSLTGSAGTVQWDATGAHMYFSRASVNEIDATGVGGWLAFRINGEATNAVTIYKDGNIGGYGISTPTARLHLPAGTSAAGTAPFKYEAGGVLNTTAVAGQKEFDDVYEYITPSGTDRRTIKMNGRLSKSIAGGAGDTILTAVEASNAIIEVTGGITGNRTVTLPLIERLWTVFNDTSGAYTVTFIGATGTGIVVATGKRATIYSNTTNIVRATADV